MYMLDTYQRETTMEQSDHSTEARNFEVPASPEDALHQPVESCCGGRPCSSSRKSSVAQLLTLPVGTGDRIPGKLLKIWWDDGLEPVTSDVTYRRSGLAINEWMVGDRTRGRMRSQLCHRAHLIW
jgi:hypothetical protein